MESKKTVCKDCGAELDNGDKDSLCTSCREQHRKKWIRRGTFTMAALAVLAGVVCIIRRAGRSSDGELDDCADDDSLYENASLVTEQLHAAGEKYWNSRTQNWEQDGKPYTYRVTYKDTRDGQIHTHDYGDCDSGYEDYLWYKKQPYTIHCEWDHVPPADD